MLLLCLLLLDRVKGKATNTFKDLPPGCILQYYQVLPCWKMDSVTEVTSSNRALMGGKCSVWLAKMWTSWEREREKKSNTFRPPMNLCWEFLKTVVKVIGLFLETTTRARLLGSVALATHVLPQRQRKTLENKSKWMDKNNTDIFRWLPTNKYII